jgi:acetolactate synthase-1/2/3 large subunit
VAVGACFARPDRRVTHITGDGDLMMGISELDTAIRYSLPLTIFVLNDQAMGQERHNLLHMNIPSRYASYPSPDFAELASALGATGYRIEDLDGLKQINQTLEGHDGVAVVDVRINGEYLNPVSHDTAEHLG